MTGLRPYQSKIIDQARDLMRTGVRRVLIEAPTGSGKTMLTAEMFKGCLQRGKTAHFIVHRRELVEQTAKTFKKQGIPFGIIAAGFPETEELIQLCSIQTRNRREVCKPFFMAIDEAHHCSAASYQKLEADFRFGLSATPITPSGGGLGKWFDQMIAGPTIPDLQAQGYLSHYRYFAPSIPDLSEVGDLAGEYNQTDIDRIMRGKTIVGDIVKHWHEKASGLLTIGFAASISASRAYVEAFQASGVTSAHIDGETPTERRRAICEAYGRREIMVLWNVGIAEEGFDIGSYSDSDVTIEAMIGARPTKSLRLARQINGRVLRPKLNPAIILDHAGNFTRHGMPNDIIEWKLAGESKRVAPPFSVTQCPVCFLVFRNSEICPHCGDKREVKERKISRTEGELKEIAVFDALERKRLEELERKRLSREVGRARTLEELLKIEHERGYKSGWARMKYGSRRK